jgi:serine/threonine protein kinase
MPAPASIDELFDLVRKSGVLEDKRLLAHMEKLRQSGTLPAEPAKFAALLVRDGLLTNFQAAQLMLGKWRRFTIGKYKVLERLGSGGMGSVFLCEHKVMRRRVAVKVLPTAKAHDPSSLERFYREARAVAALDHPNIVHAYDIDQDDHLHFIVLEYVDGASLQDIVRRSGPLSAERACHYIRQAALALEHASKAGLVHRDIKPGNVLVDRAGVVKVLDLGLARFFNDEEDNLTRKYDENILGTADYLAPEQADDSHDVDIRADIYSLGGTLYYLLTARTPFGEGSVPQKLIWHRTRQPKPVDTYRSDVPLELQAVVDRMMAKEPAQRYQTPAEIALALAPWTRNPIAPPSDDEMPQRSPAVSGGGTLAGSPTTVTASSPGSGAVKKTWQVSGAPAMSKPPSSSPTVKPPSSASKAVPVAPAAVTPRPGHAPVVDKTGAANVSDRIDSTMTGTTRPPSPSKVRSANLTALAKPGVNSRLLVLMAAVAMFLVALLILAGAGLLLEFFAKP